jgi:hypothetical protein
MGSQRGKGGNARSQGAFLGRRNKDGVVLSTASYGHGRVFITAVGRDGAVTLPVPPELAPGERPSGE